jgi:hypothetical protein
MTALFSRMSGKSSLKLRVAIAETLIRFLTRLGVKFTIAFHRRDPSSFARFVQVTGNSDNLASGMAPQAAGKYR